MTERIIDEELKLIPYYRNDEASLPWYQDLDVCKQDSSRMLFAIMLDDRPIGELQFKQMDLKAKDFRNSFKENQDIGVIDLLSMVIEED